MYSLEGFVFFTDVQVDALSFHDERVPAVILDQHVGVLLGPQLDEGLDRNKPVGVFFCLCGSGRSERVQVLPRFLETGISPRRRSAQRRPAAPSSCAPLWAGGRRKPLCCLDF